MTTESQGFFGIRRFTAGYSSIDEFSRKLVPDLMEAVQHSSDFPTGAEASYFKAFPVYNQQMAQLGDQILNQIQSLMDQCNPKSKQTVLSGDLEPAERFGGLVEVVDSLLEQVDTLRDRRRPAAPPQVLVSTAAAGRVLHANIPRPQLRFPEPIDNSSRPFVPRLKVKPHALPVAPLPAALQSHIGSLGFAASPHPYQAELTAWQPPSTLFSSRPPRLYPALAETSCTWVDTVEALEAMAVVLEGESEIAVDLENHDYRSYQGFLCLMQISTRRDDFLVDVLALRGEMHQLAGVFANPAIVKVLHGADYDILWLQRDLGLYIVNMFDTGQATRALEYPSFGLAYLLSHFCSVTAQKQYQLADWRLRPLPPELLKYAQEDTHYLLYIYDRLRNELIARSAAGELLRQVLEASRRLCLQTYEKFVLRPDSWRVLYNRHHAVLAPAQQRVFARLYAWRDQVAREQDESVRYVLPNQHLFRIAEALPSTVPSLLACCSPVPPLLRVHAQDVLIVMREAQAAEDVVEDVARALVEQAPARPDKFVIPSPAAYHAAGWLASPPRIPSPPAPALASPPRAPAPRLDFQRAPAAGPAADTATAIKRSFTATAVTNPHGFEPFVEPAAAPTKRQKVKPTPVAPPPVQSLEQLYLGDLPKKDKKEKRAEKERAAQERQKSERLPQPRHAPGPATFDYGETAGSEFKQQARTGAQYKVAVQEPHKKRKHRSRK